MNVLDHIKSSCA